MKSIIVVRPRFNGRWAVVRTNHAENALYWLAWQVFWYVRGRRLATQNPTWWAEDYPALPDGF